MQDTSNIDKWWIRVESVFDTAERCKKELYNWEFLGRKENLLQEHFRTSAERRAHNIEGFSSLGDVSGSCGR
eukprot:4748084-Ditylum_brightwellii.AAC.1